LRKGQQQLSRKSTVISSAFTRLSRNRLHDSPGFWSSPEQ